MKFTWLALISCLATISQVHAEARSWPMDCHQKFSCEAQCRFSDKGTYYEQVEVAEGDTKVEAFLALEGRCDARGTSAPNSMYLLAKDGTPTAIRASLLACE